MPEYQFSLTGRRKLMFMYILRNEPESINPTLPKKNHIITS